MGILDGILSGDEGIKQPKNSVKTAEPELNRPAAPYLAAKPPPRDPPALPLPTSQEKTYIPVQRGPDGRLLPGTRANGPGRPKGILQYVRALTDDGFRLTEIVVGMADGWVDWYDPDTGVLIQRERCSANQRLRAIETLYDRGLLPRVNTLDMNVTKSTEGPSLELSKLSPEELRTYLQLVTKIQGGERVVEGTSSRTLPAQEAGVLEHERK